MKDKYSRIIHPLKPLYDENSKVLILGSFPSVKTREYGFFYGHKQNRFWKIMEILFETTLTRDIDERKYFLLGHHIALYDSICACDIIGSSDASIKNVVPSDLKDVVEGSKICKVFCNGGASYKYYNMYHRENLGIEAIQLPSTSPANARYSLEDLVKEWKIILKYI